MVGLPPRRDEYDQMMKLQKNKDDDTWFEKHDGCKDHYWHRWQDKCYFHSNARSRVNYPDNPLYKWVEAEADCRTLAPWANEISRLVMVDNNAENNFVNRLNLRELYGPKAKEIDFIQGLGLFSLYKLEQNPLSCTEKTCHLKPQKLI